MKIKTSELQGAALDYAVAVGEEYVINSFQSSMYPCYFTYNCEGRVFKIGSGYSPSTDWAQGGPIIELEGINTFRYNKSDEVAPWVWGAHKVIQKPDWRGDPLNIALTRNGPTLLIAAMRCYVASKVGDEVEIPDELIEEVI